MEGWITENVNNVYERHIKIYTLECDDTMVLINTFLGFFYKRAKNCFRNGSTSN